MRGGRVSLEALMCRTSSPAHALPKDLLTLARFFLSHPQTCALHELSIAEYDACERYCAASFGCWRKRLAANILPSTECSGETQQQPSAEPSDNLVLIQPAIAIRLINTAISRLTQDDNIAGAAVSDAPVHRAAGLRRERRAVFRQPAAARAVLPDLQLPAGTTGRNVRAP